eukprot:jgi/Tetstr1/444699/TSEL_032547.t1
MLLHAGLDRTFWYWAYLHAVYLCNRQWSSFVNAIPYTLMIGRKPDLTDLHVFGCVAWVNIPVTMRAAKGKMTPKSWPGIYVGQHEDSAGYRIYNPATKRETVTHDVVFDEEGDATALPAPHSSGSAHLPSSYVDLGDYHPALVASAIAEAVRPYPTQMAALALPAPTVRVSKAPRNYEEAISNNHPDDCKQPMDREITYITKMETFVWISVPKLRHDNPPAIIIQTAWAFAEKHDKEGNLIKRKARVVVRGDQLTAGENYDDTKTSAPFVSFIALRTTIIALAVQLDWEMYQFDVAYRHIGVALPQGLKGTPSHGLIFRKQLDNEAPDFVFFVDSDWATFMPKRRSRTGYLALVHGTPVASRAQVQKSVALSIAEAEFVALCMACKCLAFTRVLLRQLNHPTTDPVRVGEDNRACIVQVKHAMITCAQRHIDLKF